TRSYGDWSSDVCSSDLTECRFAVGGPVMKKKTPARQGTKRPRPRRERATLLRLGAGEVEAIQWVIGENGQVSTFCRDAAVELARSEERRVGKVRRCGDG